MCLKCPVLKMAGLYMDSSVILVYTTSLPRLESPMTKRLILVAVRKQSYREPDTFKDKHLIGFSFCIFHYLFVLFLL